MKGGRGWDEVLQWCLLIVVVTICGTAMSLLGVCDNGTR